MRKVPERQKERWPVVRQKERRSRCRYLSSLAAAAILLATHKNLPAMQAHIIASPAASCPEHNVRAVPINHNSTVADKLCSRQAQIACEHYAGRHNLLEILPTLRYHMPAATTIVDVGANKGLFSARVLELWRPELGIASRTYAMGYVDGYMKRVAGGNRDRRVCGVTHMCTDPDPDVVRRIRDLSPVEVSTEGEAEPFVVHSFEPSLPLFEMHDSYRRANASREVRRVWRWHRLAASDFDGNVPFSFRWDEGGSINVRSRGINVTNNTEAIMLDSLAYGERYLFDERIIDIVKIDAEAFDARVIAGASRLLEDHRIRVLAWETPNRLPVTLFGRRMATFGDIIDALDRYGKMTCYFPALKDRTARITGCWDTMQSIKCKNNYCPYGRGGCTMDHSNALCVHREQARELARVLESNSLLYK